MKKTDRDVVIESVEEAQRILAHTSNRVRCEAPPVRSIYL